MDSEVDATSCSVCQEIYSDPRCLLCGHSFCLKCLRLIAGNKQKFPCPICRFMVDLRDGNVDQLPKNFVLGNVIEAKDKTKPSTCMDHNKSLDLFCEGCDVTICSKCLLMHHKGHAIEDIDKMFSERNEHLASFLETTKLWASKTQEKRGVVERSRISMEKNIDSIGKTVQKLFKKWHDSLQMQHDAIVGYLHHERDQRRDIFDDAERVLDSALMKVTGLDTEISKLRIKTTAFVVQQYSSIKARQEDTERKILQDIETCFTPPDNLKIEVHAPWIEEAIDNIKLIDMKQTQARPGPHKIAEIQEENVILKRECEKLRDTLDEVEKRLSKIAGDLLTHDNVNIADSSDADRPTKLSEIYSELFDNEWTDAFEELTEKTSLSDEAAITFLLEILMNAFRKCKEITWDRYESLKLIASTLDFKQANVTSIITTDSKKNVQTKTTSLSSNLSIEQEQSLKNIWRATTSSLKHESLKLLYTELSTCLSKYETDMPQTYKYITVCTDLCWKMGVQEKPMHLDIIAEKQVGQEKQFDTDKFRAYTKTGKSVAYVVWPALFLHEGGAMLAKGIAQGCQKVLIV